MYVHKKITEVNPGDTILMSFLGIPHAIYPVEVHVDLIEGIDGGRFALRGSTSDTRMSSPTIERGYEPDETLIVLSDEREENSSGIDTSERAVSSLVRDDVFLLRSRRVFANKARTLTEGFKIFTVVAVTPEKDIVHVVCTTDGKLQEISLPAAQRVRVLKPAGSTL